MCRDSSLFSIQLLQLRTMLLCMMFFFFFFFFFFYCRLTGWRLSRWVLPQSSCLYSSGTEATQSTRTSKPRRHERRNHILPSLQLMHCSRLVGRTISLCLSLSLFRWFLFSFCFLHSCTSCCTSWSLHVFTGFMVYCIKFVALTKHDIVVIIITCIKVGVCHTYTVAWRVEQCTILASKVLFHQTLVAFWLLELSWLGWTESHLLYVSLRKEECWVTRDSYNTFR